VAPNHEVPGWEAYEAALAEAGGADLDDLIARPVRLLESDEEVRQRWQARFAHVAVDEFQDFDTLQYRFLSLLAPADVTVIGDPDQSIYGFRGADPTLFDRFAEDRPGATKVALVQNYRSTSTIIEASSQMIGADGNAARSALVPFLTEGSRLHLITTADERTEAEFVVREVERLVGGTSHRALEAGRVSDGDGSGDYSFGDIAILVRLKAQQPALEDALARSGIPYRSVGADKILTRGQGREVLGGLRRGAAGESSVDAVRRLLRKLELPPEDPLAAGWIAAAAGVGAVSELLERVALRLPDDDFDPRAEAVTLLTLHASKGLEFDVVFLIGCEDGILPYFRDGTEPADALADERRLLYVGMTRAGRRLYLTRAETRQVYGERRRQGPSRFLTDIEEALVTAIQATNSGRREKRSQGGQLSLF
jgi:superfamily I DNA/RNA helicase